jgi:hypothetical protein
MRSRLLQLLLVLGIAVMTACTSAGEKLEKLGLPATDVIIGWCGDTEVEGPLTKKPEDSLKVQVFTFESTDSETNVPWTKMDLVRKGESLEVYTKQGLFGTINYITSYRIGDDHYHFYGTPRGRTHGFVMLREEQWLNGTHLSAVKVQLGDHVMWTSTTLKQTCAGLFWTK